MDTGPQPILGIWIHAISNASVTLQWNHVRNHLYEINITPNYQRIALPIKTSQNKVSLQGLVPKATYSVTVVTVYENLRSDPVELKVTPGVDEPKPSVTVEGRFVLNVLIVCMVNWKFNAETHKSAVL